jgi:hypothetical protein
MNRNAKVHRVCHFLGDRSWNVAGRPSDQHDPPKKFSDIDTIFGREKMREIAAIVFPCGGGCVVVVVVWLEPFSQFPGNREKYREFGEFWSEN